jgi:hypothetical protein
VSVRAHALSDDLLRIVYRRTWAGVERSVLPANATARELAHMRAAHGLCGADYIGIALQPVVHLIEARLCMLLATAHSLRRTQRLPGARRHTAYRFRTRYVPLQIALPASVWRRALHPPPAPQPSSSVPLRVDETAAAPQRDSDTATATTTTTTTTTSTSVLAPPSATAARLAELQRQQTALSAQIAALVADQGARVAGAIAPHIHTRTH